MAAAEFTAHIGSGDEAPKFDAEAAERYLQEKQIHKLMGGLMQSLVDSKPSDPVDFLVDALTQMERREAAVDAEIKAEERAEEKAAEPQTVQQGAPAAEATLVAQTVEPEPEA
jgi:hypothetical protein